MIIIEKRGQTITLTRDGETFRMPASEAPALIAELLEALGVAGARSQVSGAGDETPASRNPAPDTRYLVGYQLGRQDGEQLGYAQRDREYVIAATKAQRAAARALLAGLPAAEARAA